MEKKKMLFVALLNKIIVQKETYIAMYLSNFIFL